MGIVQRFIDRLDDLSRLERDGEMLRTISESAKGESVNPGSLSRSLGDKTAPVDLIDSSETPHYLISGSTIDIEGDGAGGESIIGWDRDRRVGASFMAITDQRILIMVSHIRGFDQHSIPYGNVSSTSFSQGFYGKRISIQTRGGTFHVSASSTEEDEIMEATSHIRQKIRKA